MGEIQNIKQKTELLSKSRFYNDKMTTHVNLTKIIFLLRLIITTIVLIDCTKCEDDFVYKSYQTGVYCKPSHSIKYPANVDELQGVINSAIISNQTVKVFGSRHSITDVICTDGIPVSTQNINYVVLSDDKETVRVGSGAMLLDVLSFLQDNGRTLIHVPAFGGITIGGAAGTGAHGSSLLHTSTISDQIVEVTIIDGLGERRTINDTRDLRAFRVHLGLLGAIVDLTLKTVPLFKMTVVNYLEMESIILDGTAIKDASQYDWYQMWWFPSSRSVVVSKGNYSSAEESEKLIGNAVTNLIPDVSPNEIQMGRESFERAQAMKNLQAQHGIEEFTKQSLFREVVGKPPIFTETFANGSTKFVNPATGYGHRLQANRCSNKCAWDNGEFGSIYPEESAMAFPVNELPHVIQRMKEILEQIPAAFMMIGVLIRFSKASDGLMSIAAERDSTHVEWVTPMRFDPYSQPKDRIGAYQGMQQALIHEFDGRPHWGKNGQYYFTSEILRKRPRHLLRKFHRAMKNYDPNGIFINKFGRRVLFESNEISSDPNVKRCALQDYCLCSKNSDCADLQVCSKLNGIYPVCREMIPDVPMPSKPIPLEDDLRIDNFSYPVTDDLVIYFRKFFGIITNITLHNTGST